jgi:protein-L-isoaspartate(D-aspartate) O-methyltransferase
MSNPDYSVNRRAMIDSQLRTSGISVPWVVAAMGSTAREEFVPAAMRSVAYMDRSITLSPGRKLSPAVAAAMMLEAAEIGRDDAVLLIGAGTGYLASIIAARAKQVIAVEEDAALFAQAAQHLAALDNVTLVHGQHAAGAPDNGPYQVVIVDGAIAELPAALSDQLSDDGRVVCGLADGNVSRLAAGYRRGGAPGQPVALRPFADTEIAPLPGFARKAEFVF